MKLNELRSITFILFVTESYTKYEIDRNRNAKKNKKEVTHTYNQNTLQSITQVNNRQI